MHVFTRVIHNEGCLGVSMELDDIEMNFVSPWQRSALHKVAAPSESVNTCDGELPCSYPNPTDHNQHGLTVIGDYQPLSMGF